MASASKRYYDANPDAKAKKDAYNTEYHSTDERKKYRAELGRYNYHNKNSKVGDNKDASHKNGKIKGLENQSKNRGRKLKSFFKKIKLLVINTKKKKKKKKKK